MAYQLLQSLSAEFHHTKERNQSKRPLIAKLAFGCPSEYGIIFACYFGICTNKDPIIKATYLTKKKRQNETLYHQYFVILYRYLWYKNLGKLNFKNVHKREKLFEKSCIAQTSELASKIFESLNLKRYEFFLTDSLVLTKYVPIYLST